MTQITRIMTTNLKTQREEIVRMSADAPGSWRSLEIFLHSERTLAFSDICRSDQSNSFSFLEKLVFENRGPQSVELTLNFTYITAPLQTDTIWVSAHSVNHFPLEPLTKCMAPSGIGWTMLEIQANPGRSLSDEPYSLVMHYCIKPSKLDKRLLEAQARFVSTHPESRDDFLESIVQ